jgi:hypothetical protein
MIQYVTGFVAVVVKPAAPRCVRKSFAVHPFVGSSVQPAHLLRRGESRYGQMVPHTPFRESIQTSAFSGDTFRQPLIHPHRVFFPVRRINHLTRHFLVGVHPVVHEVAHDKLQPPHRPVRLTHGTRPRGKVWLPVHHQSVIIDGKRAWYQHESRNRRQVLACLCRHPQHL